jgi:hypothetical protein
MSQVEFLAEKTKLENEVAAIKAEQERMTEEVAPWNLFDEATHYPNSNSTAIDETYQRKLDRVYALYQRLVERYTS